MKLWVDDLRNPGDGWYWAKDSFTALLELDAARDAGYEIEWMSLDHDLGGDDTSRRIVHWMIENDFWPKRVTVHSANPPGVYWLESMIERYKP